MDNYVGKLVHAKQGREMHVLICKGISEEEDGVVLTVGKGALVVGKRLPPGLVYDVRLPKDDDDLLSVPVGFQEARELAEFILGNTPGRAADPVDEVEAEVFGATGSAQAATDVGHFARNIAERNSSNAIKPGSCMKGADAGSTGLAQIQSEASPCIRPVRDPS
jgi:hypothetical protein